MKTIASIGLVLLATACGTISEPLDRGGTVLFEIEYVNYAWVPTWKGYYIDSGGSVFSYDRSDQGTTFPQEKTEFTHDELMAKLSAKRAHVRELPMGDVLEKFDLIGPAAAGQLSPPQSRCADAGLLTFRAYRFDASRQRFVPVLLQQEGDRAQANLSREARQLFAWLDSLKLVTRFEGCQP